MSKCLYCYGHMEEGEFRFHASCARKFFGTAEVPVLPYSRDNLSELARRVIRASASVTGVQAKMSLDLDRGKKNEPARFTIVGLWGRYILKPQSPQYRCLPELEDVTMKMASAAGIRTVEHTIIPMADGELGYLTKRKLDMGNRNTPHLSLYMSYLFDRLIIHYISL